MNEIISQNESQNSDANGIRAVLIWLSIFTALFALIVPGYMAIRYGNYWYPMDFYRMSFSGGDFLASYDLAKQWLSGGSIYTVPDSLGRLYSYPVLHAILFTPLTLFDLHTGYIVWNIINGVFIIASIALASSFFSPRWPAFTLGLILYAQASFLIFQFERGQTDGLILFLITLFLFLYLKNYNKYLTAFIFVFAIFIKIFPAVWGLFFLLRKEFKLLAIAAVYTVIFFLLTGPSEWSYYFHNIVPQYSTFYLGYTVEHSLFYFLDGFYLNQLDSRKVARLLSILFLATYTILVFLNKQRNKHVLLEMAILTIIMEISTPWSANYKLVILLFAFLSPLSIQSIDFVSRRPFFFSFPIFLSFILIIPYHGEYITRLPYSLFSKFVPLHFIAANPYNPIITDRRVALGVLSLLLYLFTLYGCCTLKQYASVTIKERVDSFVVFCKKPLVIFSIPLIVCIGAIAHLYWHNQLKEKELNDIISGSQINGKMSETISLIGYRFTERGNGFSTLNLIYDVKQPLPKNYQIYVHLYGPDTTGKMTVASGKNFFPDMITNYWPKDKIVEVETTIQMPAIFNEVHTGFFDLFDGSRYGPEAVFKIK